jgi:hypothetical protein
MAEAVKDGIMTAAQISMGPLGMLMGARKVKKKEKDKVDEAIKEAKEEQKETFGANATPSPGQPLIFEFKKKDLAKLLTPQEIFISVLIVVLPCIFFIIALSLLMKCNRISKIGVADILAVFYCAPCYVIFRLINPCKAL